MYLHVSFHHLKGIQPESRPCSPKSRQYDLSLNTVFSVYFLSKQNADKRHRSNFREARLLKPTEEADPQCKCFVWKVTQLFITFSWECAFQGCKNKGPLKQFTSKGNVDIAGIQRSHGSRHHKASRTGKPTSVFQRLCGVFSVSVLFLLPWGSFSSQFLLLTYLSHDPKMAVRGIWSSFISMKPDVSS